MKTIIEPFRIKSVEPIKMTSRTQREAFIKAADYNVFKLDSENVIIDLLTPCCRPIIPYGFCNCKPHETMLRK